MRDYMRDEPAHLQDGLAPDEEPSDVLQIICAHCRCDMGTKPNPGGTFGISHSICERCYDRIMAEAAAEPQGTPF